MEQQAWDAAYQDFVQQCREDGQIDQPEGSELRAHPRFRMWSNIVWTSGDFQFSIIDLSIAGISFDSNRPFQAGEQLTVRMSDLVTVRAVVLTSTAMESTPMFFLQRHRVRCSFGDSLEGMRFLVLVKDMKALQIDM